jgi:hypothetical protein
MLMAFIPPVIPPVLHASMIGLSPPAGAPLPARRA